MIMEIRIRDPNGWSASIPEFTPEQKAELKAIATALGMTSTSLVAGILDAQQGEDAETRMTVEELLEAARKMQNPTMDKEGGTE